MVTYRMDRINKEFLRRVSELLRTRIKNEHAREAILTDVRVSNDLGHARVFYTLLDSARLNDVQKALEASGGLLRSILGKEMHLRTVPELHFFYDESEAKAREMDELLDRVKSMAADRKEVTEPEA